MWGPHCWYRTVDLLALVRHQTHVPGEHHTVINTHTIHQLKVQEWWWHLKSMRHITKNGLDKQKTILGSRFRRWAVFFGFTGQLNTTYVFTKDLCPCTTKAVVRAANDGGVAFILLPCPMSLFKWGPACPRVILCLWTVRRGRNIYLGIYFHNFHN